MGTVVGVASSQLLFGFSPHLEDSAKWEDCSFLVLFDLTPPKFLVAPNLLPVLMTFVALMVVCCVLVTVVVMKFL